MSLNQGTTPKQDYVADGNFGLVDVLAVLVKNKKLIILMPLLVAILAAAASFMIPEEYSARVRLLPPRAAQSGAMSLISQLGVSGAVASATGIKNESELYVGMLRSRTIADRLIEEFDLRAVYDTPLQETARRRLESSTVIEAAKDGLITIDVEDRDRKRVAPLANAYVKELMRLTQVLAVTEASQRRLFFERQLEQAKDNLADAELALKKALDTKGVVSVDADSRAVVETVSRLRAQISAKEIQLNSMTAFVTSNNPSYLRVKEELSSLRAELAKLENGRADAGVAGENGGRQTGLENIKVLRNVKYYEMLYELLAKQYEAARLDEAKQPSVVQVLDSAVEPERKSKPKRAIIVGIAGVAAMALAILWSFLMEAKTLMLRDPVSAAKWAELKAQLKLR